MPEFVTIKHPDLEGEGRSSREAFEKVWKDKGFELVDEEEAVQTTTATEESTPTRSSRRSQREGSGEGDQSDQD